MGEKSVCFIKMLTKTLITILCASFLLDYLPVRVGVVLDAPSTDAVCESDISFWPFSCQNKMQLGVSNFSTSTIEIQQIDLMEGEDKRIQWNFDGQMIQPGSTWDFTRSIHSTGEHDLVLTYLAGGVIFEERTKMEFTNSTLESARRECEECNGDFGRHGIMGIVSCLCRMEDAGKPCDDGNDCEGKCVSSKNGFRCSEFRTVFGCHSYLPDGWSKQDHGRMRRSHHICVD